MNHRQTARLLSAGGPPAPASAPAGAGAAAEPDDRALVEAARSGPPRDRAALAILYQRYAPMVHALLLARVDASEAEDLAQDVFVRAARGIRGLRDAGLVGPWLAAIARNRAAAWRRGRWLRRTVRLVAEPRADACEPGARLRAEEVLAAIRSLPPAYRETLLMRLVAGMTGPEIAARTGLSHGSVRVNLTRGMKLLRDRLGEAPGEEDGR